MNPALDSRARFEATMRDQFYGGLACPSDTWNGDHYTDLAHHMAWRAWQAAIASTAAPAPDIFAAAKVLAECMDYPWEFMPAQGRDTMRAHVRAVLAAAFPTPPIAALAAKETT